MNTKAILALILLIFAVPVFALSGPQMNISDLQIEKNSDNLDKVRDLRNFASDEKYSSQKLFYSITNKTNTHLIDCFIENKYFISCNRPEENLTGMNVLTIEAQNPDGVAGEGTFRINVVETDIFTDKFSISTQRDKITLETGQEAHLRIEVKNSSREKECFEVSFENDSDTRRELETSISEENFCISAKETLAFDLAIRAKEDARADSYRVDLKIKNSGDEIEQEIIVDVVDDQSQIEIKRLDKYYICKEPYMQEIKLEVQNSAGSKQKIKLSTENDILLPSFEFDEITLNSRETEELNLIINTNQATTLNEYQIEVILESQDHFVQREILVRLTQCDKDAFEIKVDPAIRKLLRGQEKEFTITITSTIDEEQEISLSSESDLENRLDSYKIKLPANAEKKIKMFVKADELKKGRHKVAVNAWNQFENEKKEVEVVIEAEHKIEMLLENNNFEARVCSATKSQVFEITFKNNGDFDEKIKFNLQNSNKTIQAILSDKEITVKRGAVEKAFVFINPSVDTSLGDYTITFSAKSSNKKFEEKLKFRVIESQEIVVGAVQISSYPTKLTIQKNSEKIIPITIKNITSDLIEEVTLRFTGLKDGISAIPVFIGTLNSQENKTADIILKTDNTINTEQITANIEVNAKGALARKSVVIAITPSPQDEEQGTFISGLFTLFSTQGAVLGVTILMVVLVVMILLSLLNGNKSNKTISEYVKG